MPSELEPAERGSGLHFSSPHIFIVVYYIVTVQLKTSDSHLQKQVFKITQHASTL